MAKLLFKLRDVPEDEANDVRDILEQHNMSFYETTAGTWNISMPGIWLNDETQYSTAMELVEEYQVQRARRFQDEYAELERTGHAPSLLDNIRTSPLRFIVYIFSIVVILYISVSPFLHL